MEKRGKGEFEVHVRTAVAHHEAGRLGHAEAAYLSALELAPQHPVILHNLGVVSAARKDYRAAIVRFDASIAAEPRYASAHYNRAVAMEAFGSSDEAIRGFARTVTLEPDHYAAHRALGFLYLARGQRGRSLDHFARTYELRRGDDRTSIASRSLQTSTRAKLIHDVELFRHIARQGRNAARFEIMAKNYETVARRFPDAVADLTKEDVDLLGDDYNTAVHISEAPELAGRAVRMRTNVEDTIRGFRAGEVGAAQIDDLLTDAGLAALRQYLLGSSIWHDFGHIGGFVASYLEDGLACPLVLQIADELRATFPDLLGNHPLSQAWAFKGLMATSAVDMHADDAAVSINFWITPTDANLRPARGGLVVCRAAPPDDWVIEGYEGDRDRILSFLARNEASTLVVPYRQNRAVLFESRLFHWSDSPEFSAGYENHRINITLLYGTRSGRGRSPLGSHH